jgi:Cytochrome c, mono- and diheme variants
VSWINARRRRPAAGYAALLLGLVVVALVYGSLTSTGGGTVASAEAGTQQDITAGKALFQASCSSCHGLEAQGTSQAPSLIGAGAAAVDFQMSTGRMPAKEVGAENDRKPVTFTPRRSRTSPATSPRWAAARDSDRRGRWTPRRGTPASARNCSAPTARNATASPGRAAR